MTQPEKHPYPHFLIKEIHEQPEAVRATTAAQLSADGRRIELHAGEMACSQLRKLSKIRIAASGSSRHAGMAGKFMIQELARVPVEVEYASEFQQSSLPDAGELTIVITQSGETADTLAALRVAKSRGSSTLAITNVADSTIASEADGTLITEAGPEISIASTKSFTAQLTALFLFAVHLGEVRGTLDAEQARAELAQLLQLPQKLERTLALEGQCRELAQAYQRVNDMLFIGRGIHYPIAMDGALKLKETACIHAEGYPAGEMRHGPYALMGEHLPVLVLAARNAHHESSSLVWEKNLASIREIRKGGSPVIAVASEDDRMITALVEHTLLLPPAPELLLPVLEIVPLQLLAYYMAVMRGLDVDRPRNLVKAVLEA